MDLRTDTGPGDCIDTAKLSPKQREKVYRGSLVMYKGLGPKGGGPFSGPSIKSPDPILIVSPQYKFGPKPVRIATRYNRYDHLIHMN